MPFDWKEYLALARFLQSQVGGGAVGDEAARRSAVSRAYYAAYGHAHRYACTYLGFAPSAKPEDKSQDHGKLRNHLKSRRRSQVSQKLDRLREWRNACDYEPELTDVDLPSQLALALQYADYVFQALAPPQGP